MARATSKIQVQSVSVTGVFSVRSIAYIVKSGGGGKLGMVTGMNMDDPLSMYAQVLTFSAFRFRTTV